MPDFIVAVLTNSDGAHLEAYLAGLAQIEEVTSVVVADPSGSYEATSKKILGKKFTAFERDYGKTLIHYNPAMAIVTVEASKAPPLIEAALTANCHVLAEKPSCIRADDFEPLARLAEMKHRHLMLAMANRVRGTVVAAKRLIRTGQIGKIYGCELQTIADQTRLKGSGYQKSWFADRDRAGGGHLIWLGIHWIDLAMFLTDSKITDVAGFAGIVGGQPLKVEDAAVMALRFDNGSLGTITSGYYLDKGKHLNVKIWGSHGWIELNYDNGSEMRWYSTKLDKAEVKSYEGPPDDGGYTPFIQACVKASVDPTAAPPITGAEGLSALKTIFGCYHAAETGNTRHIE